MSGSELSQSGGACREWERQLTSWSRSRPVVLSEQGQVRAMWAFGPFRLDSVNQCVWREATRLSLTPKPYAVLHYLVTHAGRLVTPDELLGAIWPDTFVQPEVLRQNILEIRRVLGDRAEAPEFIQTLPKRGWEFIARVTDESQAALGAPAH